MLPGVEQPREGTLEGQLVICPVEHLARPIAVLVDDVARTRRAAREQLVILDAG